jgi:ADP-ribosylglycohydrolase
MVAYSCVGVSRVTIRLQFARIAEWQGPGEWTDDTAMALALAESIGARGLLDKEGDFSSRSSPRRAMPHGLP